MSEQVTRCDFVKLSSAAGAALGLAATPAQATVNPPGWHGTERIQRIATNCEMCFWRCGAVAEVANGKVVRIEGNPDHPLKRNSSSGKDARSSRGKCVNSEFENRMLELSSVRF